MMRCAAGSRDQDGPHGAWGTVGYAPVATAAFLEQQSLRARHPREKAGPAVVSHPGSAVPGAVGGGGADLLPMSATMRPAPSAVDARTQFTRWAALLRA